MIFLFNNVLKVSLSPKIILKMINENPKIDYFIIGSGMDDAFDEREHIFEQIKQFPIKSCSNSVEVTRKARDISILKELNVLVPETQTTAINRIVRLQYPIVLKKKTVSKE